MKSKNPKHAQMQKILSTSMIYHQNISPQWVSDTQLNYMSQYDFITYDLDQDRIDLIQRCFCHTVIAVKYSALIGYRNVRIIYLYKQKTNYQWQTPIYNFMILPSLNFNQDFFNKRITIPNKKISLIQNFNYFSDGQFVIFPILYEDHNIGIVYMGLANNLLITYNLIEYFDEEQNSGGYKLSSMMTLGENQPPNNQKYVRILQNTCTLFTKSQNDFVVICKNSIYLLRVSIHRKQFELLDKIDLGLELVGLQLLINSQNDSFTMFLTKTYIIIKLDQAILLYYISDQSIILAQSFNIHKIGLQNCKIGSISGSFNSNKFIFSVVDSHIIYQMRVNDMSDNIQYVNCIDLQRQHLGSISKILISSCARSAAIFTLSKKQENNLYGTKRVKKFQDVINFSIFKIQLYTQLGIPQSSLYLKQIKYKNRSKRVNRLVMPKIYERLYSLTGSQVHTLQSHKISGVLFFDIHPHGFYMIVSESFNMKIYSLQYNSMNLLYSISLQNLKKVLYSPDGSCMIIFSSRKLKILDAYSFQVKYQICQKNNSIIDVCFGPKHSILLILYDNGVIVERSFYDFDKIKNYRIFSHNHRKINSFKLDERNQNMMLLLEDGCIVTKIINNLTAPDLCLCYEDDQKISQFHIDQRNHAIFTGTRNGILRLHNISLQKFSIKDFKQIYISQSQITAITSSSLQNYVYVGNIYGDITMVKYNPYLQGSLLSKSSKILNNVAPKVSPYYSFDFQLVSNTKFQGNSQQNALQDKLETLIQKIQHHSTNYRQTILKSYDEQQQKYQNSQQLLGKNIYKQFEGKSKRIQLDLRSAREKYSRQKKEIIQQYQNKLKQLFKIQYQLQDKKKLILQNQQKNKNIQLHENKIQLNNLSIELQEQIEKAELFNKKQNFILTLNDLEEDYKIADIDILKTHNKKISEQLREIKAKCMELNKMNSYLQTAKINIMSRRVQQQTLQHRIRQQLKTLIDINNKQKLKISTLLKQLKSTEDLIHKIQNKVKNTPNNVISSDKADSDLCSYKIWMKSKAQQEVDQLEMYFKTLDDKFEDKSQQIVQLTTKMKKNVQMTNQLNNKLTFLKQKLKNLRYHSVVLQSCNINLQKKTLCKFKNKQNYCQAEALKAQKIASMEKVNEKAIYSENRNLKIHTRKIKNLNKNNAELLHQYQNLKYENKQLIDKQIQFQEQFEKIRKQLKEVTVCNQKLENPSGSTNIQGKRSFLKGISSQRTSTHNVIQTPFLKYIRQRSIKTKKNLKVINFNSTNPSNIKMRCTIRSQRTSRII